VPLHEDARALLLKAGFDSEHLNYAAWNLLALAGLAPNTPWNQARRASLTVNMGIMKFVQETHGKEYKTNTRESFRKALRDMEEVGLVLRNADDASRPAHSKDNSWALTDAGFNLVRTFNTPAWDGVVKAIPGLFLAANERSQSALRGAQGVTDPAGGLMQLPESSRMFMVTSDAHGTLIKQVIEQMAPATFGAGWTLLYADPGLALEPYVDQNGLAKAGVRKPPRTNRPDLIAVTASGELWFVEAVDSSGHFNEERRRTRMALVEGKRPVRFVTVFPSRKHAKMALSTFAPGTYVWFASEATRGLIQL